MKSIPFTFPDFDGGLFEAKGKVFLEDEFIVLDMETAFMGEFNKQNRTVKVEIKALSAVWLEKGLFRDKLCLRPKKIDLLDALPGSHVGEAKLRIWRKHRSDLQLLTRVLINRIGAL